MLTFALAKGRLAENTVKLLCRAGIDCANVLDDTRQLELFDASGAYRFIMVKPSDVPVYIERGIADAGVAGKDTLLEAGVDVYEMLDLGFGACRLCIAGRRGARGNGGIKKSNNNNTLTVATKYYNVAKKYYEKLGQNVDIVRLSGSVELAPILDLSDVILDIVESGKTLEANNLEVFTEICKVSARLAVNKVSLKTKKDIILPLIAKLEGLVTGSGK